MKETIFFFVFSFCLHSQQLQSQFRPLSFEEKHKSCLPNNLNVSYVDKCKAEISKHIDYLESQKPKPKEQIGYWKSVLKNLEKKNKQFDNYQKKQVERRKEIRESNSRANISGCENIPYINPRFTRTSLFKNQTIVRVFNQTSFIVDIDSVSKGKVVSNLCPGGSFTMYLNLDVNEDRSGRTMIFNVTSLQETSFIFSFPVYIIGNFGYINRGRQVLEYSINIRR